VYDRGVGLTGALGAAWMLGTLIGAAGGTGDLRYALYPLQPLPGLDRTTAAALEDSLRRDLQDTLRLTLFSRNDTAAMLRPEGGSLGLSCDNGALRCLSDLGRLLGAQKVIYGQVGPDRIFLKLVDVEVGGEERRVEESGEPVASLLEAAAMHLLAPKSYLGSVAISAPAGARISVDGAEVGKAPLEPLPLIPGRHQVSATLADGTNLHATVDVRFQVVAQVDLSPSLAAEKKAGSGLSPWGIGLLGGAGGLAAAGVVCGVISQSNRNALGDTPYPVQPSQAPLVAQQLARAHDFALAANILYVTAGAMAVAAVVVLLVDHPGATSDSTAGPQPTITASPGGAAVHF
jgi:hypothetical protein